MIRIERERKRFFFSLPCTSTSTFLVAVRVRVHEPPENSPGSMRGFTPNPIGNEDAHAHGNEDEDGNVYLYDGWRSDEPE